MTRLKKKIHESELLKTQIDKFLSNGGQITAVPIGFMRVNNLTPSEYYSRLKSVEKINEGLAK